ncbi:MAG: ribosome small subunit-dependent GTPase A, partial [Treponemataceae bacterium]|nr:ribosome small subunit-dependent GTPase A [Treponemataceae bacterium]
AGMSADSTAALATSLLAMGVDGSKAATAISRMYTNLSLGSSATAAQKAMWESLGYTVMRASARTREGIAEFAALLEGRLSAFVGQSGVGKSSLVNILDDSCILKTGSLSKKYGRGSHTTTKGTLNRLRLNTAFTGGVEGRTASIIDTPGIRRFMLCGIEADDLALYFREFRPLLGQCTFGMSCTHTQEPGCKILEAVHAGAIAEERYESWRRIRTQIEEKSWDD